MDLQLTLSANSKVYTENTLIVCKLGACAAGTVTHGVGKTGPHGPFPLASQTPVPWALPQGQPLTYLHIHTEKGDNFFQVSSGLDNLILFNLHTPFAVCRICMVILECIGEEVITTDYNRVLPKI